MAIYRGPGGAGDATTDSSTEAAAAINAAAQAATSATNAESSATQAANSATAASSSASSASTSASTATTQANNAASSASAASVSALAASTSATNAASSASTATTQANNASTSATSASTSASTAQSAATLATSKATDASNSASVATTKASEASTSASNAATSATSAASSATSASSSASTATTQASNAATSATAAAASASTATTKASEASTSATNAATSATNAANSATAAATSATNSANSATSSAGSASSAAAAQIAAETARDQTLAAYDNFDDRYLGTKASDPALDNDGNALVAGALYFNSTDGAMKVYTGTAWVAAYASLSGALLAANNLSDLQSASSARTNLGLGTAATTASTDYATAAQGTKADTAYGWGNHASAGYAADSLVAHLAGTEIITGAKTFSSTITGSISGNAGTATTATNQSGGTVAATTGSFSSSVTLSGGTANGVAYLNGSKVLTTGSALTFNGTDQLNIWGGSYPTLSLNGSTGGQIAFGTANSFQQYLYSTSNSLNYYASNASSHIWSISSSEQMRLTSTGLGIGTSSPETKLTVTNNVASAIPLAIKGGTASLSPLPQYTGMGFGYGSASGYLKGGVLFEFTNGSGFGDLVFALNRTGDSSNVSLSDAKMRLDSYGNLGLGVTPSAWASGYSAMQIKRIGLFGSSSLDLNLTSNMYADSVGYKYVANGYATNYIQYLGQHQWYTAPSGTAGNAITFTQAMTLDASGNLGVGTSSPSDILTLAGGSSGSYGLTINNAKEGGGTKAYFQYDRDNGLAVVAGVTTNGLVFKTLTAGNTTEKMRIDSSGNVGMGTSSPGFKLDVQASTNGIRALANGSKYAYIINDTQTIAFQAYGAYSTSHYRATYPAVADWDMLAGSSGQFAFVSNGSERMRIDSSGNVGIGTSGPLSKLSVESSVLNGVSAITLINSANATANGQSSRIRLGPAPGFTGAPTLCPYVEGVVEDYNNAYAGLAFGTYNGTLYERMRITKNGGVSFGSSGTATGTSGQVLTSNGDAPPSWQAAAGIGSGQTWQNVASSRAAGTTYTNSSGKPIMVAITNSGNVQFYINTGGGEVKVYDTGSYVGAAWIVPNGATYRLAGGFITWCELR